MKNYLAIIIVLLFVGCTRFSLVPPHNNIHIATLKDVPLDIYDWKTIKLVYGAPDLIDNKNNAEIYISTYETWQRDQLKSSEVWYLALHYKNKDSDYSRIELYREFFEGELPLNGIRKNYEEIHSNLELVKQIKLEQ